MKIYNKPKKNFDFNRLYELYHTNLDEGRLMLYDNLPVFISKYQINADENNEYWDIYNSIFLCIDESLIKCTQGDYEVKQVYLYIQARVRGWVLNLFNNKGKYHRFYEGETLGDYEELHINNTTSHIGVEGNHIKVDNEIIHRALLSMQEPYMSIIIDTFFVEKKVSKSSMAKSLGVTTVVMKEMYNTALDIFKTQYEKFSKCD